jgi:hypothetical protein
MASQRSNVALAVVAAYPLAAWAFTGCLVVVISIVRGADMGWWTVFAGAPLMVPLLTFQSPDVFMLVYCACVLLTWFVIYRVIRRRFGSAPAN